MKVEIDVTQADIQAGKPSDCQSCPIALAASRAFGLDRHSVRVAYVGLMIQKEMPDGGRVRAYFPFPLEASRFVEGYDEGDSVNPFRFTLDDGEGG